MSTSAQLLIALESLASRRCCLRAAKNAECSAVAPASLAEVRALSEANSYTHLITDEQWWTFVSATRVERGLLLADTPTPTITDQWNGDCISSASSEDDIMQWITATAPAGLIGNHERRSANRVAAKGWILDATGQAARLLDLSMEGARVEFVELDAPAVDFSSCVVMPMLGVRKQTGGRMVWRREHATRRVEMGIAFNGSLRFY